MTCPHCNTELPRYPVKFNGVPSCHHCWEPVQISFDPDKGYRAQAFDPVVVFRDAAGNYSFPGRTDTPAPEGLERVELRTTAEVRRFEREMNLRERLRHDQAECREDAYYAERQRQDRAELRQMMQHMSPAGRALAEEAMRQNDQRGRPSYDPNFHLEAFAFDSSNREAHRDEATGWRGRRG